MHMSETVMGVPENPMRLRMEEAARMAGLKYIVNVVYDVKHRVVGCFCGDVVAAHPIPTELSMKSKQISQTESGRTFAIIFQTGDTVLDALTRFAQQNKLDAAHFTAIGAFSDLTLAYFDWESRQYQKIPVREQVEVLSLIGDIADDSGKPKVHAHVVVGKRDGSAHGGHLIEAHVRPTLEVILTESPGHLRRKIDPASGLALISL